MVLPLELINKILVYNSHNISSILREYIDDYKKYNKIVENFCDNNDYELNVLKLPFYKWMIGKFYIGYELIKFVNKDCGRDFDIRFCDWFQTKDFPTRFLFDAMIKQLLGITLRNRYSIRPYNG